MTGTELTTFRKTLMLSQHDLGELLGVTQGTIALWEGGKHRMPTTTHYVLSSQYEYARYCRWVRQREREGVVQ